MKKFQKYLLLLSLPLMACSTQRIAREQQETDNVYVSNAEAIEYTPYVRPAITEPQTNRDAEYNTEQQIYGDDRYANDYDNRDYYDGMSYSSRIYRFHNYSPWRNYYDPYYDYRFDNFGFNQMYHNDIYFRNSPSWMFNLYVGPSYGAFYPYNYNPWGYFYSPYRYGMYGGIYSYYNTVPYYYGNFGGGNFYPGGYYPGNTRINRPRPMRGSENTSPYYGNGVQNMNNGSRAERYGTGTPAGKAGSSSSARPNRSQDNGNSNNSRNNNTEQSRPSRAERYTPPPAQQSAPARSNDSGSNDSKPRPSRTGGR